MNITDAQLQAAFNFVRSQKTHIEQGVNAQKYPAIQYPFLVPVDTSANEWADTVTYLTSDRFGRAQWLNGNADSVPMAGNELGEESTRVHMAGIGYGFGYKEIHNAQLHGVNLPDVDAAAARFAYETFVDNVAMRGDARKGFHGLINHPAVTPVPAVNGNWSDPATTNDQIADDINAALDETYIGTNFLVVADTLLLDPISFRILNSRRLSGTSDTLLDYIRRTNTYTSTTGQPLTIRTVRGLESAGAGGLKRMIAYRRNPSVVKMHIPMPHRFLGVFHAGPLRWEVPGVFRLGGLDIRLPKEFRYVDGL